MNLLNKIAMAFYGISKSTIAQFDKGGEYNYDGKYTWFAQMLKGFNNILYPILIAFLAAASIYAIFLGINLARAETSEKREEAKKRLIWALIGVVLIFVIILVIEIVAANAGKILGIA